MRFIAVPVHLLSFFLIFLAGRGSAFCFPIAASAIMTGEALPPPPAAALMAAKPGVAEELPPASPPVPPQTAGVAGSSSAAGGSAAGTEGGGGNSPSHLVVLSHGLSGTADDLSYLKRSLERAGGKDIFVHSARCNQGKTKDGVAEGGKRLAQEILELVDSKPSLSRISLVGNSLGGLYVRYAAKLLYSDGDVGRSGGAATIAGLAPSVFMTIACPHLGVRRFTYVPLPSILHPLAGVFVGKTGSDLFLSRNSDSAAVGNGEGARKGTATARDGRDTILLYGMGTSEEYLRPLKAFRRRRAYANRHGDFMVPYGTAAFLEPDEADDSETLVAAVGGCVGAQDLSVPAAGAHAGTDSAAAASADSPAPAVLVGTESFSIADRLLGAKNGAIVGFWRVGPAALGTSVVESGGQGEPAGSAEGSYRIQGSPTNEAAAVMADSSERRKMEEEMAAGLNSCGWEKVSVDFGSLAPFSHNKICALSRTRITTALYGSGKSIVDHAANFLVAHDIRGTGDGDNDDDDDDSGVP